MIVVVVVVVVVAILVLLTFCHQEISCCAVDCFYCVTENFCSLSYVSPFLFSGDIIMTGEGHKDWISECDFHPG